jgi:hypothetical protein
VPTKVVDQGNELTDVSTPKKQNLLALQPLFKSLAVYKATIKKELNMGFEGGEENDGNGDCEATFYPFTPGSMR